MLDDNNRAIFKERESKNQTELALKQLEIERDQLQRRVQDVQTQFTSLSDFKQKYTQQIEQGMAQ